jgi:N-methylhydantoinase A
VRAQVAEEPVVFATQSGSRALSTRIYARDRLLAGDELPGPAIVEQPDSTTVIPPGARAHIDEIGNLVLSVQEA